MNSTFNFTSVSDTDLGDGSLLWIHCNKCGELYARKVVAIFLLACHHVTCENCSPPSLNDPQNPTVKAHKCPICDEIVRGCKIGNHMPTNLKNLFHPQPWIAALSLEKTLPFQRKQKDLMFARINEAKLQLDVMQKNHEEKQRELEKEMRKLRQLEQKGKILEQYAKMAAEEEKQEEERQRHLNNDAGSSRGFFHNHTIHGTLAQKTRTDESVTTFPQTANSFFL